MSVKRVEALPLIKQYPIPTFLCRSWRYIVWRACFAVALASLVLLLTHPNYAFIGGYFSLTSATTVIALIFGVGLRTVTLLQESSVHARELRRMFEQKITLDDLGVIHRLTFLFYREDFRRAYLSAVAKLQKEEEEADLRMRHQALCLAMNFFLDTRGGEKALRAQLPLLANAFRNAGGTAENLEIALVNEGEGGRHVLSRLLANLIVLLDTNTRG